MSLCVRSARTQLQCAQVAASRSPNSSGPACNIVLALLRLHMCWQAAVHVLIPAAAAAAAFVCASAGVQECAYKPKQGGAADDNDSEMQVESSVRSLTGGAKSGRRRSVLSSLLAPDGGGIIPGLDVYREAVSTATTLCRGCCVTVAYETTTMQAQLAAPGSHHNVT